MAKITREQWTGMVADANLPSLPKGVLQECFDEWTEDGDQLAELLAVLHWARVPLAIVFPRWKDPSNPLGSLAEIFKWARIAARLGIRPDVFCAQVFHESGLGLKQDAILGIKAGKRDLAAGTFKRLRTREVLKPSAVDALKTAGDWIEDLETFADGKIMVRCWQLFHFAPGLADDFERLTEIYEAYWTRWKKPRPEAGWTARDFLEKVTQGPPSYATENGYAGLILGHISSFQLGELIPQA